MKRWLFAPFVAALSSIAGAADQGWPFDQPRNVAVITLKQIIQRKIPILRVTHDVDDHGWQFLNPSIETVTSNASVVSLEEIVKLDSSVLDVADLPVGWSARRKSVDEKWVREKLPAPPAK